MLFHLVLMLFCTYTAPIDRNCTYGGARSMPRINLTDRTVSGLHPLINGQVDYYDVKNPRFGVRISYNGTRTWFVFDIDPQTGKRRRITLGRYPEMTLAEARSAALDKEFSTHRLTDYRLRFCPRLTRLRLLDEAGGLGGCVEPAIKLHSIQDVLNLAALTGSPAPTF